MAVANASIAEGTSGSTNEVFSATLSVASGLPITVSYATADGSATTGDNDYLSANGALTIPAGVLTGRITVQVNGDTSFEPNETYSLQLSNPINVAVNTPTVTGTIVNDDAKPSLSVSAALATETSAQAVFTVRLSANSTETVAVNYATAVGTPAPGFSAATRGADFEAIDAADHSLTFLPSERSKLVTVAVVDDTVDEPIEIFNLVLSSPSNASFTQTVTDDDPPLTISSSIGVGTILDDDAAPIAAIVGTASVTEGNSGNATVALPVTLTGSSTSQTLTVNFATSSGTATSGTDFVASTGSLIFTPGQTAKTITVQAIGDLSDEPSETFNVTISGTATSGSTSKVATITILDDDTPPALSISPARAARVPARARLI